MALLVQSSTPSFNPEGLEEYLRQTDEERRQKADEQIRTIQTKIPEFVVEKLKGIYPGPEFLSKAVKSHEILVDAFKKRTQTPIADQGPLETYLDFLDFRKIIEASDNWQHFKDELSIPLPGEKKGLAKYVKWFDEINRLRRIPAHPYGKLYKDEDVELLNSVYDQLKERSIL